EINCRGHQRDYPRQARLPRSLVLLEDDARLLDAHVLPARAGGFTGPAAGEFQKDQESPEGRVGTPQERLELPVGHGAPAPSLAAAAHLGKRIALDQFHLERPVECAIERRDYAAAVALRPPLEIFDVPASQTE